jgi:16S rRNA (guanine527-N7)-methyltransferase
MQLIDDQTTLFDSMKNKEIGIEEVKEKFEFIISRAVTEFPTFYRWVQNKISKNQFNNLPNGILYLKGGDLTEELKEFQKRIVFYNLKYYFTEEFFDTKKVVFLPMQ